MKTKIFTALAVAAALASCSTDTKPRAEEKPVSVRTYSPVRAGADEITVSGMLSAKQTAAVSTKMMGTIEKIYVKQGDVVRQGQLLVVINATELAAKRAQAVAMVTEADAAAKDAQKDLQRYEALRKQNSVSDKELENVSLRHTSANARVQMARQGLREVSAMMAYTHLRAPFSGVVTQKMVDEGSIANPGMPLLMVEQSGELNVTASVPESYVSQVKKGDEVKVDVKATGTTVLGYVSELSPSATTTGGQYAMKVSLREQDRAALRAGMYATVRIQGKPGARTAPQVLVRKSSVVTKDQLQGVYVASKDNKAVLHWVRLGNEAGDDVIVLSGLNGSERVIDRGGAKLYNGQKIRITE